MSPPHGAAPAIEQGRATRRAVVEPGARCLARGEASRPAPDVGVPGPLVAHRGDV
jgi:hypothetical protein